MNTLDKIAITSRSFSANKYLVDELRSRYTNITLNNSGKTLLGSELLEFLDGQNKVILGIWHFGLGPNYSRIRETRNSRRH